MAATKNSKEVILVNCQEIPETICVETKFITAAAAKQKKNEDLFYVTHKNGSFELTKQDPHSSLKNFRPGNKQNTFTVSVHPKPTSATPISIQSKIASIPVGVLPKPILTPGATGKQCQPPPQAPTVGTIGPLATAINLNNSSNNCNVFGNSFTGNGPNSAVAMPLGMAFQSQTLSLNASVLSAAPMGITNPLNIANIRRTFNDQIQQTDYSALNMKSIAVQCKLDDELDIEWPATMEESLCLIVEDNETEKENFLKFVKDNSMQHKNWKECLICGEICKSNKFFYGHMAIHQGPNILCSKCGSNLDHRKLLLQHKCRAAQQLENAFLQCPSYTCGVKAVSRLELYDHINEHANNRMYKCTACRKSFCTGQEFLRHLLIRAKCYTSAKGFGIYRLEAQADRLCRVRVFTLHTFKKRTTLVKSFLSQRLSKERVCKICLKYFTNKYVYGRHRIKCIRRFQNRLLRKGAVENIAYVNR